MAEYTIDKIEYGGNVYKLQDNVSGYTTNSGTVTSVGISNATNGGLSISGSPITSSGTISVGHSNVLSSAQTTQAVYPIKIDKNGHISAYGNAVTIPTIPSNNVTGSGSVDYLARWSGTNTLSSTSLSISTSYNSSSDSYGTIKLYVGSTGQLDWKGQLVFHDGSSSKTITITPPSLTASRTITLPDKTGTIALTSDIPTVSYPVTSVNNKTGAVSLTASDVGALASGTTYVSTVTTTAGTHTAISSKSGAVSFNVPTKTSHLTNDSGYLTGITSSQVTTALGYTPYNSTNPNGYTSNTGTVTKVTAGTGLSIGTTAGGNFTTSGTINHTNSVTAQTTQAVYPIKIDAQGHISAYGSAVTIPTVPSNIVNTITTTAGAHTAITSQKGNVSFSIPTTAAHVGAASSSHTHGNITNGGDITATAPTIASGDQIIINDHSASKITNGPTFDGSTTTTALTPKGTWESFAKSDTNTTYALSGALSSHKFTSTLTAGGSGSGTSTSDFTLAAGTGITITDDTSARKMTIACSVTNTDTKVSTAAITSGTTYYPVLGADTTSAATKFYDKTGISYVGTSGGGSVNGIATLTLGNNVSGGSGKYGKLTIYSASQYGATFQTGSAFTANRTFSLPDKSGYIALEGDLNSYLKKPTSVDSGMFGWKLSYVGTDTPVWDPPETYIIGIGDDLDNPGIYTLANTPDDIRNAWSSTTFILDLSTYNSSTTYNDTQRLVNYYIENIQADNDYVYQVIWFSGIKNCWVGGKVRTQTILCGIYLDSEEQYHTDGEVIVKISDDITASGKMYFGPENDELRGVKFNTIDSPSVQISANSTATFTATYEPPQENQRTFLTGVYVRSTGTNYSRVFLYALNGTRDDNTGVYTFTCAGRNTYSSAATVSVRFRFLTVTVLDSADGGND